MILIKNDDDNFEESVIEKILLCDEDDLKEIFAPKIVGWSDNKDIKLPENVCVQMEFMQDERESYGDYCKYKYEYIPMEIVIDLLNQKKDTDERAKSVLGKVVFFRSKESYLNAVEDEEKRKIVSYGISILESEEKLKEFIENERNKRVVIELSHIFGKTNLGDRNEELDERKGIFQFDFINNEMIERYRLLRQQINVDIDLMGEEVFGEPGGDCYYEHKQKAIDTGWCINPRLREYIFDEMDPKYTVEEKIAYIYIKMCKLFEYDGAFEQKDFNSTAFNKEKQEQISLQKPKLMCAEFSRLCTKLFNEMQPEVEARCIWPKGLGHEACGVLIRNDNVRINLEAIDIRGNFNDLARAKLGLELKGVEYISDRENTFKNAFDRVYYEMLQKQEIPTGELISTYVDLPNTPQIDVNFSNNMNEFLTRMNGKIKGNELLNVFQYLTRLQYFGDIDYYFIYENENSQKSRNILIKNGEEYYDLKTDYLLIEACSKEKLSKKLSKGVIRFQDDEHVDASLMHVDSVDEGWDDL